MLLLNYILSYSLICLMEERKNGLLPKWIYLATIIKLGTMIASLYKYFKIFKQRQHTNLYLEIADTFNYFYVIHFIFLFLRLISIRNICKRCYFIFIVSTFCLDIFIYVTERYFFVVSLLETVLEIIFSVVSLAWMVFLYPYYLHNEKEMKNTMNSKEKKVK
ncbi:hypothetical protein EDEG_00240 [Edhazardia aedis USNM 41457]|uniref:Uncharacterized protein n=1 Tax=Edhazardia aedis (strain USNM 41457) TaxID=1003232 RepID=J9DKM3_EDHAE|nr:hypothetical protein EDEG_00240 [Edhazardia aedis USNM 41457]|eukprot:EJW03135.1 hypothetical protein EDEG_00240 [Edhazardia aedis USNM 41457]